MSLRIFLMTGRDWFMAPGLGFGPRYRPPEGRVLPLDDPGKFIDLASATSQPKRLGYGNVYIILSNKNPITIN